MQAAPCSASGHSVMMVSQPQKTAALTGVSHQVWFFQSEQMHVIPSHARLEKEINKAPVSTCHSEELQELCEARGSTIITGTHTQYIL